MVKKAIRNKREWRDFIRGLEKKKIGGAEYRVLPSGKLIEERDLGVIEMMGGKKAVKRYSLHETDVYLYEDVKKKRGRKK